MDELRLEAEALAIPWGSAAFSRAETVVRRDAICADLRRRLQSYGDASTAERWADHVWGRTGERLVLRLLEHVDRLIVPDGDAVALRLDDSDLPKTLLRWRFISLRVPAGTLAAAAAPPSTRPTPRVRVLPPVVGPGEPVAHQHLHFKAACSFEAVWTHTMSRSDRLRVRDAPEGVSDGRTWVALLSRVRLARRWLADALRAGSSARATFGTSEPLLLRAIGEFVAGNVTPRANLTETELWRAGTRTDSSGRGASKSLWHRDPLADGGPWPEGRLLALAFDFVRRHRDDIIEKCFVQYLRARSVLHGLLVHDTAHRGLNVFAETFERLKPYRDGLDDAWLAEAAIDETELDLAAVELRTGPPARIRDTAKLAKLARDVRHQTGIETGWVFHIIRDPPLPKGPGRISSPGRQAREIERSVGALERALRLQPRWLSDVRGLDIASRELDGPLWLALEPLRRLRGASRQLAAQLGLRPLRLTLHVGEDFAHLLSGLRAIDEPFVWRLIGTGDRLGHCMALGLDARQWCARHRSALIPLGDRLLDLSWALGQLRRFEFPLGASSMLALQEEERALGLRLGLPHPTGLHDFVGHPGVIARCTDPLRKPPGGPVGEVIGRWLRGDAAIREVWSSPVEVDTTREAELLVGLQDAVARRLASTQTIVEVNPTSNLLVGGLRHPIEQPLFRLRPLDPRAPEVVPITISADDPLQFATTLADEYAYAWAGAVLAGTPPSYVRAWLQESARTSRQSRFTLPR